MLKAPDHATTLWQVAIWRRVLIFSSRAFLTILRFFAPHRRDFIGDGSGCVRDRGLAAHAELLISRIRHPRTPAPFLWTPSCGRARYAEEREEALPSVKAPKK